MSPEEKILTALDNDGFVVVPGLIPPNLLEPLRESAKRAIDRARDDSAVSWDHVRLVGKQFPPWPKRVREDVWGVQHIMKPEMNEHVFVSWYASEALIKIVKTILGCQEEELQMELLGLLINPTKTAFSLIWHRDTIPPETSDQDEKKLLQAPRVGTQWNTALYADSCLMVVPGSHNRVRTHQERDITIHNPRDPLEGELRVDLQPGDTVFYDNNILHRGVYGTTPVRATLHGCIGTTGAGPERARNILQHDMNWVRDVQYTGRLERMRLNLIRMAESVGADDLGYSLSG
ncbi:hypothetical protein SAICODRAFT_85253 [Saitoella complicata NRRL Y-17804]|uniref:Phytanoyl-CoA dioxygenase n=1 Tax=Saitoella complicata (strain BCRC 22490 / CBS 7301 / JCM 7358 / NBRC 10748 / NRRL Y-17804) TaxID=698492 RepID=A0A0E9NJY4_SAICN|nr:uncharacterized protein SAICODRAFT_85253 [Saitoella complicata NRRL Y-17804]ODQ50255.1 hypothetical protein SAICODRAFT_85253 [Saitoella complicata NRRL Y-17804]GAO50192.1 hypothetical protein G7K_4326-t1 [Saitoella complicata NRRL Y-17804]